MLCGTLERHYQPLSFPGSAARHPWATLPASLVPRQCGATPLGDITCLFRSTTVRRDTLGRHYQPPSFHDSAARHPWATLPASLVPRQCGATPLGDITCLFRSTTVRRDTLGRHYQPFSFPGSAVRHSWATLSASLVPRQCGATPLGDIISLSRSTTVLCGTLERHYQPFSFHDSAARHPWATLSAFFVPRQRGATPLGDITYLFRSRQ